MLGPVLFNLYIRSIYSFVQQLGLSIFWYAEDHQITKSFKACTEAEILTIQLNHCFNNIKSRMNQFYLQLNDSQSQIIVFGPRKVLNALHINGINIGTSTIRFVSTVENIGIYMDQRLSFEKQIVELKKRIFRTLRNIRKIRFF